jgi:hypothetical protein
MKNAYKKDNLLKTEFESESIQVEYHFYDNEKYDFDN